MKRFSLNSPGRNICGALFCIAGSLLLLTAASANDLPRVIEWNFGTEEATPSTAHGDVVRDQAGPRPPEFPNFSPDNTAIRLPGKGARIEISDPGEKSAFDFTNGDAITMEAWVKLDAIRDGQPMYVVSKGRTHSPNFSHDNQNWSLRLVGEKGDLARIGFLFTSVTAGGEKHWHRWNSQAAFEIATGWHHVAISYEFGKPENIRGWIDGQATDGTWDVDGPTKAAPVVDNDDVWIGSSMGGSSTNSLQGMLDAVAVHRVALTDAFMAKRFQRKGGSQGVLVESQKMPELGEIAESEVLVQLSEGLPDYRRWPYVSESPKQSDQWTGDTFLLSRLPQRYDDWGIRSAWKPPVLVRLAADLKLPGGAQRFLLRPRQARLAKQIVARAGENLRAHRLHQRGEPSEDRIGAGARDLLRHDDRHQACKARLDAAQRHVAGDGPHVPQARIGVAQRRQAGHHVVHSVDAAHGVSFRQSRSPAWAKGPASRPSRLD